MTPRYFLFTAWVGVDDEMKGYTDSSVVFQVFGDGRKLFDSGVLRLHDPARNVNVDVATVDELKLVVTDAGDGVSCDHADWGEPVLSGASVRTALPPQYRVEAPGRQRLRRAAARDAAEPDERLRNQSHGAVSGTVLNAWETSAIENLRAVACRSAVLPLHKGRINLYLRDCAHSGKKLALKWAS